MKESKAVVQTEGGVGARLRPKAEPGYLSCVANIKTEYIAYTIHHNYKILKQHEYCNGAWAPKRH